MNLNYTQNFISFELSGWILLPLQKSGHTKMDLSYAYCKDELDFFADLIVKARIIYLGGSEESYPKEKEPSCDCQEAVLQCEPPGSDWR